MIFSNFASSQERYPLRISDGIHEDTLYFGLYPNASNGIDVSLGEAELPPLPPSGIFDVRFTGENLIPVIPIGEGTKKDFRQGDYTTNDTMYHKLKFQWASGSTYLRLNWWGLPVGVNFKLSDLFGGVLIDSEFVLDSGSFLISNPGIVALLFDVRYQVPRPVELSSFASSVSGNDVLLKWITSSETNNSGFEIQRKDKLNIDWNVIEFVPGKINSTENTIYNYTDRDLDAGSYNYRLKQIDLNGNFEYFNLTETVVIGNPDDFFVSLNYPNPFNPVTKINYSLPSASDLKISLFDSQGKLVKVLNDGYSSSGYFEISIDASDLTSGLYYCNFEYGNNIISRKIVVLK